ncbi:hypothetical protein [Nonomuraea sp. NPDC002799]
MSAARHADVHAGRSGHRQLPFSVTWYAGGAARVQSDAQKAHVTSRRRQNLSIMPDEMEISVTFIHDEAHLTSKGAATRA